MSWIRKFIAEDKKDPYRSLDHASIVNPEPLQEGKADEAQHFCLLCGKRIDENKDYDFLVCNRCASMRD